MNTSEALKKVAAPGIAPGSPPLQGGANLSQLHGHAGKVVSRPGNAPRSAGYQPAALLLSYRERMPNGTRGGTRTH